MGWSDQRGCVLLGGRGGDGIQVSRTLGEVSGDQFLHELVIAADGVAQLIYYSQVEKLGLTAHVWDGALFSAAASSAGRMGLLTEAFMPAAMQASRSPAMALAVMAMIVNLRSGHCLRIRRVASS